MFAFLNPDLQLSQEPGARRLGSVAMSVFRLRKSLAQASLGAQSIFPEEGPKGRGTMTKHKHRQLCGAGRTSREPRIKGNLFT